MAFNEELAQRLRDALAGQSHLVEKKMFGGIGFMLQGNMACGVNSDDLVLRTDPGHNEQIVIQPHVKPFDLTGRPMIGWILVEPDAYQTESDFQDWVEREITYALSLPPK